MNVLHLLATGRAGGIEVLVNEFAGLSRQNNYYVFFWDGGFITESMKKSGYQVIELKASKKEVMRPIHELDKIIKREKINVIITHHASPMLWYCMNVLKKKNSGINTIGYAHANLKDMFREKERMNLQQHVRSFLRKKIFRQTYKNANAVVAISNSVYKSFREYSFTDLDKIKIIYNGVDVDKFRRDSYEGHTPVRLVYAGRLVEEKGVQNTLQAIARLNPELNFVFDIAGEGVERKRLEAMCRELGIEKKVIFHGVKENMPNFLMQEDIFVHAPVWEEGFGIALVEGMAAGLLCVGYKRGAIPEIIDDGINGFIVEPANIEKLAEKLEMAIQYVKSKEGAEMRKLAYEKAQKFSIETYVNALDELCEQVGTP